MSTWKSDDLTRLGDAEEVKIAGARRDGTFRTPVIVWAVRVGDRLYTRSVNGPEASWCADDEIDAAYEAKYGRYPGPVKSITSDLARSTTLEILPHQAD
jgi:hypothetical protein